MLKDFGYSLAVKQHKNRIYSYSFFMLGNKMDADDVTQEVLIRLWQNMGNFNLTAMRAWVMKTTHNLCMDYLRRRKTQQQRNVEIDEETAELIPANNSGANPDTELQRKLLKEKLSGAINNLPESLKSVFVLYEINGLRYKDIGEILSLPMNSVKVNLFRARKKLQEELKQLLYEKAY